VADGVLMRIVTSKPSSPVQGEVFYDTTMGTTQVWTGSHWSYLKVSVAQKTPAPPLLREANDHERRLVHWANYVVLHDSDIVGATEFIGQKCSDRAMACSAIFYFENIEDAMLWKVSK
jgi:hypothetical protein